MEITDADQAENLITRFRSGGNLSEEEVDALTAYLTKDVVVADSNDPVGPETAERGRLLKLALQWHRLLDEIYSGSHTGSL